ncbi:MAG: hypothetical protein CSB34_06125 [Desulfobulbus propionicus]|nr:MAG: hypothetical protein CSB34_06125 [Desulfobulbus propionicus]
MTYTELLNLAENKVIESMNFYKLSSTFEEKLAYKCEAKGIIDMWFAIAVKHEEYKTKHADKLNNIIYENIVNEIYEKI